MLKKIATSCLIASQFLYGQIATAQQKTTSPSTQSPSAEIGKVIPNLSNSSSNAIEDNLVMIGTGSITGIYYPAGGAVCRLVNRERKTLGLRCAVESTPGSIYNLKALKSAEIDLALVQSDWQEKAYFGLGDFNNEKLDNLRFVFSLHNESFTIVTPKSSMISKLSDLKGHVINVGPEGSGARATMDEIIKAKGWNKSDFQSLAEYRPVEQAKALCDGKVDALLLETGHPSGAVQDVASTCEIKIVEVDDADVQKILNENPEYSPSIIPGGIYQGVPKDIKSFGVKATLVTTADASEKTIYNITKLVFDNLASFKNLHPVFSQLSAEKMATEGKTAPYHEGSKKYFMEKGLIKGEAITPSPTNNAQPTPAAPVTNTPAPVAPAAPGK
jgi:TRAP transporter TAXI family solute receptor